MEPTSANIEHAVVNHPLEPLTAAEIRAATALVAAHLDAGQDLRFALVMPEEPPKADVLAHQPGEQLDRRVLIITIDRRDGATHEAVVSLGARRVERCDVVATGDHPYGQPPILVEEFALVEEIVKADPAWQAAVRRRGVTDLDLVQIDPFSAGQFEFETERGRRMVRAISHARSHDGDNAFAHPIEGLIACVDVNAREVVELIDGPVVPIPEGDGNYDVETVGPPRETLRPLDIVQPEGPSFQVDGHHVTWEGWRLRVSMNAREGLVLHTISFEDGGRDRPIIYRASISEMVVPYADPRPAHFWRSAFDLGEYGLGKLANSLELGCDCLGEIHYFDAVLADERGEPTTITNAVCMHEEDYGILWKHHDFRTGSSEVRRSRRLVISFFATVGNYDYGFYWYLYLDGTIQFEAKLTGIVLATALEEGADYAHGTVIAEGLGAPFHQHLFNARLDMAVDGTRNTVLEVDTRAAAEDEENPYGNAFVTDATPLRTEREAQRLADGARNRTWKVVNTDVRNAVGDPVGYKLVPQGGATLLARPDSAVARRAGFATKHLWVTPYDPTERYAAGDYPNQHAGGDGLPAWTEADRPLEQEDIVLWHSFGSTHITRPEDWPIMPVEYVGFTLKPVGFFDRNPALDVPASTSAQCRHHH